MQGFRAKANLNLSTNSKNNKCQAIQLKSYRDKMDQEFQTIQKKKRNKNPKEQRKIVKMVDLNPIIALNVNVRSLRSAVIVAFCIALQAGRFQASLVRKLRSCTPDKGQKKKKKKIAKHFNKKQSL